MANETGYPDSVGRKGDSHTDAASPNNDDDQRKEWATGNATASDNKPIGPQSGFEPLQSSEEAHGSANEMDDARKDSGGGY
jgi:hypothetical protein